MIHSRDEVVVIPWNHFGILESNEQNGKVPRCFHVAGFIVHIIVQEDKPDMNVKEFMYMDVVLYQQK